MQNADPVTVKMCPHREANIGYYLPIAIATIKKNNLHGVLKRECLLAYFECHIGGVCNACRAYTEGSCQGCRVNMEVKGENTKES